MRKVLPDLRNREKIQAYLTSVAQEVGGALDSSEVAAELDSRDELAFLRNMFHYPTIGELLEVEERDPDVDVCSDCIYLCGNSLGLQPKKASGYVESEITKWSKKGVRGHFAGEFPWFSMEDIVAEGSAKIVGCRPEEVTAMNTLTANIHFALAAFYQPTKERFKVLMEDEPFPSDLFAVQSQIRWHGYDPKSALVRVPTREGEPVWRNKDIMKLIEDEGDSLALVFLSGVHYTTGFVFDMEAITRVAHRKGICVGFDLAHAAGNIELHLHDWEVDFALWCSYKYLNSGPGGIAGFYVHEKHNNNLHLPRLSGWWSHDRTHRFKFAKNPELDVIPGAKGFSVSNPPVLDIVLLKASLDVFGVTSMSQLCQKSRLLTGYLEILLEQNLGGYVTIVTPQDPARRGCQLSLQFSQPIKQVHTYLTRRGVSCDLREPSLMRVAPTPLYNSFTDVQRFCSLLKEAMLSQSLS